MKTGTNRLVPVALDPVLRQPHPLAATLRPALLRLALTSLVAALVFIWARPEIAVWPTAPFGLPLIVILASTSFAIAAAARLLACRIFAEDRWTVGREIGLYVAYSGLIALALLGLLEAEGLITVSAGHFLVFPCVTAMAASLPAGFEIAWTQNFRLQRQLAASRRSEREDPAPIANPGHTPGVTILPESGDSIHVSAAALLAVQAQQNYCALYLRTQDGVAERLIRTTFTQVEADLRELGIIRVHRSWLVNPVFIKAVRTKARGFSVTIPELGHDIPVSRRYRERLP